MPLIATKDATAYVCGQSYSIKKGETLDGKPAQLKAALVNAGAAKKTATKAKE